MAKPRRVETGLLATEASTSGASTAHGSWLRWPQAGRVEALLADGVKVAVTSAAAT